MSLDRVGASARRTERGAGLGWLALVERRLRLLAARAQLPLHAQPQPVVPPTFVERKDVANHDLVLF